MANYQIINADCLDAMAAMEPNSVDAIVTDPPYGLSFMGKDWDHGVPGVHFWEEALRVAKPGAHLIAFGGTRTYHRLAVAIEDAGWEIRDCLGWLYGSGFPKSHNISKALDKGNGVNRERQLQFTEWMRSTGISVEQINTATNSNMASHYLTDKSQPAIPTADMFDKLRAHLPEVPEYIERLVAERTGIEWTDYAKRRVLKELPAFGIGGNGAYSGHSEGAMCKITEPATDLAKQWDGWGTALKPAWEPAILARKPLEGTVARNVTEYGTGGLNIDGCRIEGETPRFPANICHDGSAEATEPIGEASRFFYCAKASKKDRDAGLDGFDEVSCGMMEDDNYPIKTGSGNLRNTTRKNNHPTVKPTDLMRWLVRLVTPPGGTVLDPFMGSGSTGKAAVLGGFDFIGIDITPEYCEIAEARVAAVVEPLF